MKKSKMLIVCLALAMLPPLAVRAQVNDTVALNTATAYVTNSPFASGNSVIGSNYYSYPVMVSAGPEKTLKKPSDNGNGNGPTPGSSPGPASDE